MSSSPCRPSGGAVRRTWPTHGLGKWEVPAGDKFSREVVRKVKHSSVRIENPLLALYRGTGYFSLARTFRTVRGGARTQETVGGPNGAQRSEFRRTASPDNKRYRVKPMFSCHVTDFRGRPRLYDIDNAPVTFDVAKGTFYVVVLP